MPEGKIRLNAAGWDNPRVLLADQLLEVRNAKGQPILARKMKLPDPALEPEPKPFDYISDELE